MTDLNGFATRIKQIGQSIERNVDKTVIQTGILVSQTVIMATPVDTGRARGNWMASLGSPITTPAEREDPTGGGTISENSSIISARQSSQDVYITNNLSYINKLNDGWSAQAPAGFVEKAAQVAITHIKSARIVE